MARDLEQVPGFVKEIRDVFRSDDSFSADREDRKRKRIDDSIGSDNVVTVSGNEREDGVGCSGLNNK